MARVMLQRGLTALEAHCDTDRCAVAVALTNLAGAQGGLGAPTSAKDTLQLATAFNGARCSAG